MSDIEDEYLEKIEEKNTFLDELLYNYDVSKYNYEKLLDDIHDLWENVLLEYLEDYLNYGNGFLQGLRKNLIVGQKKFYNFLLETETSKNIFNDYILSLKKLDNYLKKNPESKNSDTLYYSDKMYDNLYFIRDEHIELLKLYEQNNWLKIYANEIEPLYNYF